MNWFSTGGAGYAEHRPTYPARLARLLAEAAPRRRVAVDVGCGTGQFTALLAEYFDTVIGLDPSLDQLANAAVRPEIEYRAAPAEATGLPDGGADLITVAQAAHWFDLPVFYDEVRRIAADGAVLALITYGVVELEPDLAPRFSRLYTEEIGPYWPPERRHVDNHYADLEFPFPRIPIEAPAIERDWTLDEFTGYLRTWSAVRRAETEGTDDVVEAFADDVRGDWGDEHRLVRFPVTVLAGVVRDRGARNGGGASDG
ncbi:class I SAM-dependent methyltransferase [Gordonia sp. PP30]|uniref:class I SAM-dependent methyltransferase n=1 Tax=Gordonia sp. PP30 TaxID=2935861 RepID=UPI001FFF4D53|nr:class I SAM-dependent methyltransferase [Gordonia sp. PP30]UQE73363.1 class I SAM-dependent methyltransferase [Gordonia sp. PP30]